MPDRKMLTDEEIESLAEGQVKRTYPADCEIASREKNVGSRRHLLHCEPARGRSGRLAEDVLRRRWLLRTTVRQAKYGASVPGKSCTRDSTIGLSFTQKAGTRTLSIDSA
jgi:hypothetical protein